MTFDPILLMYLIKILLMLGTYWVIAALYSITASHIGCAASRHFSASFRQIRRNIFQAQNPTPRRRQNQSEIKYLEFTIHR